MILGIIAGGSVAAGGGGGGAFDAAVIYRSTNSSSLSSGAAVPYETELYDNGNYADIGTDATRLTVSDTGLYRVWYQASHDWVGGTRTKLEKNGASAPGLGGCKTRNVNFLTNGCSSALDLTAGDYLTLEGVDGGVFGYNNNDKYTWFAIERLPDALSYCLVRKPASQSASGWGTMAAISFGSSATIHDPDGYHDESTNNTRLTTLSGQTRVRLSGGVQSDGSAGTCGISFRKNGSGQSLGGTLTPGLPFFICSGNSNVTHLSSMTPPLLVTGGTDYFELWAMMDSGGFDDADGTFFCIEEVPDDIGACLAYRSTGFGLTTSYQDFPLDTDVYDDDGVHDAAGSSAEFIVPAGASYARFHFCAGHGDMCSARAMYKPSGGSYDEIVGGSAQTAESGGFWHYGTGRTPWLPVSVGDAFKMQALSDRSANSISGCWAALEWWPRQPSLSYEGEALDIGDSASLLPAFYSSSTPTFTLETGTLPTSMSLNSSTGEISGTPSATGDFNGIQIRMSYSGGYVVSDAFDISVIDELNERGWLTSGNWSYNSGTDVLTASNAADRAYYPALLTNGESYHVILPYNKTGGAKLRVRTEAGTDLYLSGSLANGSGVLEFDITANGTEMRIEADTSVYSGTIGPGISIVENP